MGPVLLRQECSISAWHSRPSADIVNFLESNGIEAECEKEGKRCNGRSIIGLLSLCIRFGDVVNWNLVGEKESIDKFVDFIKRY